MRSSVSAWLALWLLDRLGPNEARSAIAGDLVEEYSRGRSVLWLWFQVTGALVAGSVSELRSHGWLACRAALTAYAAHQVVLLAAVTTLGLHRFRPTTFLLLVFAMNFAAGWIAGRSHRRLRGAVVVWLMFAAVLWNLPEIARLSVSALSHERFVPYLFDGTFKAALACASVTLGATLGVAAREGEAGKTEA